MEPSLTNLMPVVVSLSFNAKMDLADFEGNLKAQGLPEMARLTIETTFDVSTKPAKHFPKYVSFSWLTATMPYNMYNEQPPCLVTNEHLPAYLMCFDL